VNRAKEKSFCHKKAAIGENMPMAFFMESNKGPLDRCLCSFNRQTSSIFEWKEVGNWENRLHLSKKKTKAAF
jgi:hypothetical protein